MHPEDQPFTHGQMEQHLLEFAYVTESRMRAIAQTIIRESFEFAETRRNHQAIVARVDEMSTTFDGHVNSSAAVFDDRRTALDSDFESRDRQM